MTVLAGPPQVKRLASGGSRAGERDQLARIPLDLWQALAGLKGKLPLRDWTWEAYVSRGNTHIQADYTGMNSLQRYQYLVALPN